MSIFIHDCIECQQNKQINQKIQTASIQTFSENASYLITEYQWIQKDLETHHQIKIHAFML